MQQSVRQPVIGQDNQIASKSVSQSVSQSASQPINATILKSVNILLHINIYIFPLCRCSYESNHDLVRQHLKTCKFEAVKVGLGSNYCSLISVNSDS